jgi:hypothetical protein
METFANQAVTTLSAAITSVTATSCTVIDATSFPATGNFRVKIDSEILIVTARASNTFTITRGAEGTTPATHASGASVIHLLTKGSLEARVANRFISDIYDNKPAAGVKGRLFLPTDGLFLEYDDGTAWRKYGPYKRLKAPPQTGWSWVNQGNATVTYTGSALVLEDPDLDTTNPQIRLLVRPIGVVNGVTAAFLWNGLASDTACAMGICARQVGGDASYDGHFWTFGIQPGSGSGNQMCLRDRYYNSPTSLQSTPTEDGKYFHAQRLFWVRYEWLGNVKNFYHSADGVNWIRWDNEQMTSYAGPNQLGVFIDPVNNVQKASMTLVHWDEN